MNQEKTGVNAGSIWNALNENGAQTGKDLKKLAGIKTDKELYTALGWLLREDKVDVVEEGREIKVALK